VRAIRLRRVGKVRRLGKECGEPASQELFIRAGIEKGGFDAAARDKIEAKDNGRAPKEKKRVELMYGTS